MHEGFSMISGCNSPYRFQKYNVKLPINYVKLPINYVKLPINYAKLQDEFKTNFLG